jgi:hypothetical protein
MVSPTLYGVGIFITKEYNMKKIVRLTESDLTRIVKRVINESNSKPQFYIITRPSHLGGKGMFIYTGDDGYSMIPTSLEFRRRMHYEMDSPPKAYESEKDAMPDLKKIKKGTKHRPDLRWEIVRF